MATTVPNVIDNPTVQDGGFFWPDYLVFVIVLAISLTIGLYQGCRKNSRNPTIVMYLLANRKLWWVPVGLSILVTFQSAILFIGVPAEIYTKGLSYLLFHIGMFIAAMISALLFVPLLYPLKLTSTYEYLEMRFNSKFVRVIGFCIGTVNMCMYMGAVIFAPSTAMEAVSGTPAWVSIIVTTVVATMYTLVGGIRAVVWTDVFQFFIMVAGLLAILIQGMMNAGGFTKVWNINVNHGRTGVVDFDFDPRTRHTIWGLIIGGTLTWLGNIGVSQSNVQRFSSVPTMKGAKLAVFTSGPGFVIFGTLASFVGQMVYAHYAELGCDPLENKQVKNPNQLVPLYVKQEFTNLPGFAGLFVASLFCASLSTVSSSINSLAAMTWEDLLKPCLGHRLSEQASTRVIKLFVFAFGLVGTGVAFIALILGGPATQIALSFFGASGGPLLGMFILGAFFPCANAAGAAVGGILSVGICMWIAIGGYTLKPARVVPPGPTWACDAANMTSPINSFNFTTAVPVQQSLTSLEELYRLSYLWYSALGVVIVLVVGLLVSFITCGNKLESIDPRLLHPLRQCCCCCLTTKCKEHLESDFDDEKYNKNETQDSTVM